MTPTELRDSVLADIAAYGRKHGIEFDPPSAEVTVREVMASPIRFHEGIAVEVNLTPPWWGGGDTIVCNAAWRAITEEEEAAGPIADVTLGVGGVKAHTLWPASATQEDIAAWRSRMIVRIEAQPGMAERKAQWTEWQNERYGTPEEREARRKRTLERIRAREATPSGN